MLEIPIECHGTKHFYGLVRLLNTQIGRGGWTTKGRPIRKLRRLNLNNIFRNKFEVPNHSMTVTFKVPEDHAEIQSVLSLWGDLDGPR